MEDIEAKFTAERSAALVVAYKDFIDLESIRDQKLRSMLVFPHYSYSTAARISHNIQLLKYAVSGPKTNVVTTVLRADDGANNAIYGFVYSQCINSKIIPEYIATGPTFKSQDGEYRGRLIRYNQFLEVYKAYEAEFAPIDAMVTSRISDARMSLVAESYYPDSCQAAVQQSSVNERFAVQVFVASWFVDYTKFATGILENHVDDHYRNIIDQHDSAIAYSKIKEIAKDDRIDKIVYNLSYFTKNVNDIFHITVPLTCGQKIFPLTVIETSRVGDINYPTWREMYMNDLVANLVLNFVTPSLPFSGSWFYIHNVDPNMFDNPAILERYARSQIANEVVNDLRNTDRRNYIQDKPITDQFGKLSDKITTASAYANAELRLTDIAICVTSEFVGRTFRDIPALIISEHAPSKLIDIFQELSTFTKHMFEFIYTLYCLNSRIGVLHGDLHLNNVTINRIFYTHEKKPNTKIVYVVANDGATSEPVQTAYIFPHVGWFSTIIDFSRGVLCDYKRIENEFGPGFAEMHATLQQNRVLNIIKYNFPDVFAEVHTTLIRLTKENFPLIFKIASVIDTFTVMSNIRSLMSIDKHFAQIAPPATLGEFLGRIIEAAKNLFMSNLRLVIRGDISIADEIEWPNYVLMRELFADYQVVESVTKGGATVVDMFRSDSALKCDISDYDSWGPLLSLEPTYRIYEKVHGKPYPNENTERANVRPDETIEIDKLIAPFKEEEMVEPWMLM